MGRLKTKLLMSLRTKVLVPVILVMMLLMTVSMWLVKRHVTLQIKEDAKQQLVFIDAVLKFQQERRTETLLRTYRNIIHEPRFKAMIDLLDRGPAKSDPTPRQPVFGRGSKPVEMVAKVPTAAQSTWRGYLEDMISEGVADVIMLTRNGGETVTAAHDPQMNVSEFEGRCASLIGQTVDARQPGIGRQLSGRTLYDMVSLPVYDRDEAIIGTITFGVKNSEVQEFQKLKTGELVLLASNRIVAATLWPNMWPRLEGQMTNRALFAVDSVGDGMPDLVLNGEHFQWLTGRLESSQQLNYLALSSYEKPLRALQALQGQILQVSLCSILLAAVGVWFLVHKATEPLAELRDSAEAIGSGDFSRRIEVTSQDECGELAAVFNRMTENLKHSRDELEATVERLKTTQSHLVQSEKLSGIGEFVAGVAHELNNPLTTVMGFSELLQQSEVSAEHRSFVDMIFQSAQRCQKIVQALLSFARRHQPERKPVCLNKLIETSVEILNYQLRTSNVKMQLALDPQLPQAMVDSHQIQQVLVNMLNNARQAIESHQPKGWIKITTETAGPNVRLTIQDSGPGIAPENLSKIFDPFFTTKGIGKGTGLGLSLCYGIINEHGGTIAPYSRRGEGATFIITLPVTYEIERPDASAPMAARHILQPALGAGRKVLVIDDEEAILKMVREVLSRQGYEVDVASDGESGLRNLRQKNYDVTLCDWKMPGLNGRQVYEQVRETNPALSRCFIFITGDLVNDRTRQFLEQENRLCIAKPFSLAEFHAAVSKALPA